MDVIVEGQITKEEGIADILQTVLDLKSVFNPVLRITCSETSLQGRICFCRGGFMLGGQINNTAESGWDAIRKLLQVKDGSYAILEPETDNVPELNQSLWIKVERVLPMLRNLPQSVDVLLYADTTGKPKSTAVMPAFDKTQLENKITQASASSTNLKPTSMAKPNVSSSSLKPTVSTNQVSPVKREEKIVNPALNNYQAKDNFKYSLTSQVSPMALAWIIGGFVLIFFMMVIVNTLQHSLGESSVADLQNALSKNKAVHMNTISR